MTYGEKIDKVLENQARHDEKFDSVIKTQDKHGKVLFGPDDKPGGVVMDVDRLKVFKKVCCWFLGAFTIAGLGLIVRLVYTSITAA